MAAQDYETLVTLLVSNPPSSAKLLDQPDSESPTISQVLLHGKFDRIYQSHNPPPPLRQLVDQSYGTKLRIPADNKESMHNIVSRILSIIPLRLEKKNMYGSSKKWDPVDGREGLVSRIVQDLLRLVAKMEDQDGKVELKVYLKIEERIRVTDEDYQGRWRAKREGEMVVVEEYLEKMLIQYQQRMNKKVAVADLKRVVAMAIERKYGTSMQLESGTIDGIAKRAEEAWKKITFPKIKRALVFVAVNSKEEEDEMGECSICLGPKTASEEMDAVILGLSKCGHSFHKRCLLLWLKKTFNCPLCRSPLF